MGASKREQGFCRRDRAHREQHLLVRGHEVLLDADLAALFGVTTKRFNEQVRRNAARFPEDFMFPLSTEEWDSLRSQFGDLKLGRTAIFPFCLHRARRRLLSSVLRSEKAVHWATQNKIGL